MYGRVSSEDQAKDGYSLPEQMRGLRELAVRLGWEVQEEIVDEGWSRSTLDRPGMNRVRELVAGGGVDLVVAWKRDRFGAGHLPGWLEDEFRKKGAELRTPDDLGLTGVALAALSGVSDTFSKIYVIDLVEKTMRGKAGKLRDGKVVGSGPAPLGFVYVRDEKGKRVGLEVSEPGMRVVRRIFELVGEQGLPLHAACRELEQEGYPAPGGGSEWRASTIRRIVRNDCYLPRTYCEVVALSPRVPAEVTERLDRNGRYGIWWHGRRRVIGTRQSRRTYRTLPEEEWTGVPVGLDFARLSRENVEKARENLEDNPTPRLGGGGRDHELSGGIAFCGECGRSMTTVTSGKKGGPKFWYYACPASRYRGAARKCEAKTHHPAEAVERAVVEYVDGELLTDPAELERQMDAAIDRERAAFSNPGTTAEAWAERIAKCERRREGYEEMRADGDISRDRFREKVATLDEECAMAESELAKLRESAKRVEEMERAKRATLEMFGSGLMGGVYWFPPRLRRQVYGLLGLRVEVHADRTLTIEGTFDADLMRLTPEVEEWVEELRRMDERLRERAEVEPPADMQEGIDRLEKELGTLRRRVPGFRAEDATRR